jgi:hypothetical protein
VKDQNGGEQSAMLDFKSMADAYETGDGQQGHGKGAQITEYASPQLIQQEGDGLINNETWISGGEVLPGFEKVSARFKNEETVAVGPITKENEGDV